VGGRRSSAGATCASAPDRSRSRRARGAGAARRLTGWELCRPCDDEHVATVGASIRHIRFDRATPVLEYDHVTVLADQNAQPFHNPRRRISILGVNNYVPVFLMK